MVEGGGGGGGAFYVLRVRIFVVKFAFVSYQF